MDCLNIKAKSFQATVNAASSEVEVRWRYRGRRLDSVVEWRQIRINVGQGCVFSEFIVTAEPEHTLSLMLWFSVLRPLKPSSAVALFIRFVFGESHSR